MSIKKKMSIGILSGALGLSLIGGGTWAAFNDVETTSNSFTAGTLDLVVDGTSTMNFDIKNLKPGDYFTKKLVLKNGGSLDINQIKVHAKSKNTWVDKDVLGLGTGATPKIAVDAGKNTEADFLSQFEVVFTKTSPGTPPFTYTTNLGLLADPTNPVIGELTGTDEDTVGLAAGATSSIEYDVKVTFIRNDTTFPNSRLQVQNKYQEESASLDFVFEATQMKGEVRNNN
ncbi:TasA family protein [Pseudoneobacillus sp. C159]